MLSEHPRWMHHQTKPAAKAESPEQEKALKEQGYQRLPFPPAPPEPSPPSVEDRLKALENLVGQLTGRFEVLEKSCYQPSKIGEVGQESKGRR